MQTFEARIHGRGGQGVVTAANLLSVAAFLDGRHAQAFPSFGAERTGAPVVAYCRISDKPLRTREPISQPDAVVVQDATLLHQIPVFDGLRSDGYVLINSTKSVVELGLDDYVQQFQPERALVVPATRVALEVIGRPIPNVVMLGGFAAMTATVSLDAVAAAIEGKFAGELAEANVAAARRAYDFVTAEIAEIEHA